MPAPQRRHPPDVIQRLLDRPWRFDLVQALRVIALWLRGNGCAGDDALPRHVRFQNSLSMDFPASQVEALTVEGDGPITSSAALQTACERGECITFTVTPAFLGFFGVTGVMPHFYTDDIVDQIHDDHYEGTRAFFDIFYNRIMALYFQAACKHRVQHRLEANDAAAIWPMQLALAGRSATKADDSDLVDRFAAHYAGVLRHRPVSARLIESILADYVEAPVRIEQFVGAYDRLQPHECCRLGVAAATLGRGALLGARVRERDTRACLRIGPLPIDDYHRLLPSESGAADLARLLSLFATPTVHFELRLILRAADVAPVRFTTPHGNRLGYDTCLVSRAASHDCDEFAFDLAR